MNISSNQENQFAEPRLFIRRGIWLIISLLAVLVGLTHWSEAIDLDLRFSSQYYSAEKGWFLADSFPWNWLYEYGEIPGIIVAILSLVLWMYSRTNLKLAVLRPYLLICGLTPIIASVLLVNVILKDHSGRPRPREIVQFNGNWEYKPALKTGIPGRGHSFPCGHCSIAFTLISGVVFWRRSRKFALSSLSIGLAYGLLMSIARIAQGGHFLSDALWSLGVVLLTVTALYYFVFQPPRTENNPALPFTKKQKWNLTTGVTLFFVVLVLFVWTRRPFYKEHSASFEINPEAAQMEVFVPETWTVKSTEFDDSEKGRFNLIIQGFAPPYTTHYLSFSTESVESLTRLRFKETVEGYNRKFHQIFEIRLPQRLKGHIVFNDSLHTSKN